MATGDPRDAAIEATAARPIAEVAAEITAIANRVNAVNRCGLELIAEFDLREGELLEATRHATAHHVEAMVRQFRRSQELADLMREERQCARRQLVYDLDEDGGRALEVRLTAGTGVVVLRALAAAMAEVPLPGVAAETLACRGVDRRELEDGPAVAVETARRFACDASLIAILEDGKGEPLDVGRKTRTIPPALRRALASRDGGCVFSGCTHRRYVDGHHLRYWADGAETRLANLVTLCRFHHRAVHEGGLRVARFDDGAWRFTRPDGEVLESVAHGHTRPLPVVESESSHGEPPGS